MSDSLKDQLLALGLAKKPATPGKKNSRSKTRPKRPAQKKPGSRSKSATEISLDQAFRERAREERRAAEKTRQDKIAEDQRRRAINKNLQMLVDEHAVNDPEADIKRNFFYKGRIRSVLVNRQQLSAINQGELGLVFLRGRYFLVAAQVAEEASSISAEHVPDLTGSEDSGEDEGDHPVPDDLVW